MTMINGTNFQSVPLIINHDWTPTINRMEKLLTLESRSTRQDHYKADHYPMGSMGTLSRHWDSDSWYRFSGPALSVTMPCVVKLLDYMKELKPDVNGTISFLNGNGGAHIDNRSDPSALNYIFYSTDPNAYTWFRDGDLYEQHPSIVGSAWIIDTQKEHGVINTGTRYSLSIHFRTNYQTVKEWFQDKTQQDLTFG